MTEPRPAELIESLRRERGLTQAQACRRAGVSRAAWSAIESGTTARPRPATRVRIARALGVTPSTIWRTRPAPLHLDDCEDPRWQSAVRTMAERLVHAGTPQERHRFGASLVAVLDRADAGARDPGEDAAPGPFDELWQLGRSLTRELESPPISIVDGRLIEDELLRVTLTAPLVGSQACAGRDRAAASRERGRR